jgi:hypothetical protein
MSALERVVLIFSLCFWLVLVCGMPSFDGVAFWNNDVGSFVAGMGALEALGPNNNYEHGHFIPRFVAMDAERGAIICNASKWLIINKFAMQAHPVT